MFFTYVARELRRRRRQAVVVALGLAVGIGLVVTVSATSTGVQRAQGTVLRSLYGVATDITVTQPAGAGTEDRARFGLNPQGPEQQGHEFARDRLLQSPGLASIPANQVSRLSGLSGVGAASGGLSLVSIRIQGRFAQFGEGRGAEGAAPAPPPSALPSIPPVRVSSYSITGVEVANPTVGAITPSQITTGRFFSAADTNSNVAILDQGYATQQRLKEGSTITINGTKYAVIGVAKSPSGGGASNVYIPLGRAQSLANLSGRVNRIYVKARSASDVSAVAGDIKSALPGATVTTAKDVASQVSGSLASASGLAKNLGTWLSILALIAAFAVAGLLTVSAVGRRIREFGTLKALGWRSRRVVGQVMGEAVAQGLLGGILGIAIGVGGAFLVSGLVPHLTATVGATGAGGSDAGPFGQALAAASRTVSVPLTAPLNLTMFALAIGLALAGGVLAGALGGWRAARLRPAEALRRVE